MALLAVAARARHSEREQRSRRRVGERQRDARAQCGLYLLHPGRRVECVLGAQSHRRLRVAHFE
eukprot:4264698-Prymnesium_polylepis.1